MDVKVALSTDRGYALKPAKIVQETVGGDKVSAQDKSERLSTTPDYQELQEAANVLGGVAVFSKEDLLSVTQELNKFFEYLNTDIQFELHERTQRLMVKVVDLKNDKVLKEFPPQEFLDTIANIQEYVGVLLDKRI